MTKNHNFQYPSKLFTALRLWSRFFFSKNRFWSRALLCWFFSCLIVTLDLFDSYDLRFKLRAEQNVEPDLIVLQVDPPTGPNQYNNFSDNHYWDKSSWKNILTKLLSYNPRSIGVTFLFENFLDTEKFSPEEKKIFFDDKITWATSLKQFEQKTNPSIGDQKSYRLGLIDTIQDNDGIVRRLKLLPSPYLNLSESLTHTKKRDEEHVVVINYKGTRKIKEISLSEVLNLPPQDMSLKNKILIIGTNKSVSHQIYTPMGLMYRYQLWTNITDNVISNMFIKKLNLVFYFLALLGLMVIGVLVITNYPQTVTFFVFAWIATVWSAFSLWTFDSFGLWIPITGAVSLLILLWITHIGYQAFTIEKAHYQLQQEQKYLEELEQLKNNFVSLISHDLKTPIAKIQAVIDRVTLQQQLETELQVDFENLKIYSEELNRYIQSILKLLRVESRDFKINKEVADLNEVVEEVIQKVQPLSIQKNIQLNTQLEPMFSSEFDVTLMTEVILNLVENAIKYTPQNGQIWIKTSELEDDIILEIADSGEGIPLDEQELIWKKFTRGKNQDLKTKGSGLGLYLVKYFVELHQGKVSFTSEVGKGTSFYIRLPIS